MKDDDTLLERLKALLEETGHEKVDLEGVRPEDVADALERMSPEEGIAVLARLDDELASQSLIDAPTETARALVEEIPDAQLVRYLDILPMDDALDLREEIGEERYERLLAMIPREDAGEIQRLLSYPEDSVARVITEHFFRVLPNMTMQQVMEDLRRAPEDKYETVNDIYVLDSQDRLLGVFSLRKGLRAAQDIPVSELMNKDIVSATVDESDEDAARRMARYGLYALPVLDHQGRMVGLFTGDDAQEILEEAETEDLLKLGAVSGSAESYMSLNVWQLAKRRLPWLAALFVAETLTGAVMRHYGRGQPELGVGPLMFFVPLIIGAGGNSGAQVTTTLTRALALGDVDTGDWLRVLWKEVVTAVIVGAALGILGYLRAYFGWNSSSQLSLVVATSLPAIVLWAGSVGSLLPLGAKRLGIDPAVMSAPFITTLVDATGLIIYFEIALRILPK
ncbi:MAG TPA: magnesium transporter [Fimbriimonadaceae bacterium]|nr:magnesium transporter [Fimbriimonadaceae bacterium]